MAEPKNKYLRAIYPASTSTGPIMIDVYCVLKAFSVKCPARQHAIKKLLCAGLRGKGDVVQDLEEAKQAIERAIELEKEDKV